MLSTRGRTSASSDSSASRSPSRARRASSSMSSCVSTAPVGPPNSSRLHDNARVSAPSRLGRYPVRRRIGSGAFATVWLAYDEHLDSPVAIKVLADNWTGDLHIRQRFIEEGRFLRKVESPHVVTVYDAGELDDERPYLVMAYADQGTLADRLELSALEPSQALTVIVQVGRGPRRAARPRRAAPRRQAGQRALPHGGERPRLAGGGDGRRPRAGQGDGHVVAPDDGRRHARPTSLRSRRWARPSTRGPTSSPWPR